MSMVDDLERLSALHSSGALSDAEFEAQKALVLAAGKGVENVPMRRRIGVGRMVGVALAVVLVAAIGASKAGLIDLTSAEVSTGLTVPDAGTSPISGAAMTTSHTTQGAEETNARAKGAGDAGASGQPSAAHPSPREQLLQMLSERPATAPPSAGQTGLYSDFRRQLLARGFRPAPIPRGRDGPCGGMGEDEVCSQYPETVDCVGMGPRSGYCRMAFVDTRGRLYVVSAYGWDDLKTMAFDQGAWANAADTRHLRNIIAGRAEFDAE